MKILTRIITILMASAFVFTGFPAAQAFAGEENGAAAEEQVTPVPSEQTEPSQEVEPAPEVPAEEIPAEVVPAAEGEAAPEEILPEEVTTEEIPAETIVSEPAASVAAGETPSDEENPNEDRTKQEDPKQEEEPKDEKIALQVTNIAAMFKVADAYIETKKDGTRTLVAALNSYGYDNLFIGTFEEAAQVGYNTSKWIHYFSDGNGRKAFRIPIDKNTSYLPVISISNTYLEGYLKKRNPISRAFFARQLTLDQTKKTLVANDYSVTKALTVNSKTKKLSAESATLSYLGGPNNNKYSANLIVKLSTADFDGAFIGSKKDASEAEKIVTIGKDQILTLPVKWLSKYGDPDSLVTLIGKSFIVSLRTAGTKTWSEYSFTVNEKAGILTLDIKKAGDKSSTDKIVIPGQKSSKEKQKQQKKASQTTGGGTGAVDNSTGLKDGTYKPDKFSFSGGSGRVVITCSKVVVKGGKAFATIELRNTRSGVAEFSYVKANGQTYPCTQAGGVSVVTIPVNLNANTSILALTTKMSAAHEIAYTLFVYIKGADEKGADDLTKNKEFDEEAPQIAGLEATGEEKIEAAKKFKVFNYSDGIRLLEIDMRSDGDKAKKDASAKKKESEEEEEGEITIVDDETGEEITIPADKGAAQTKLYKGNIIKYLLVPKGVEIPAGLDKETIVVQLPLKSVYAASDEIRKKMKELGVEDRITCMEKEEGDIQTAGSFGDLKLRTLVKEKCDIVMIPGELAEGEKARETYESQAEDLANLEITLLTDRSSAEKTKKAKAEWVKVYGILYGCEEAAEQAFQAVK